MNWDAFGAIAEATAALGVIASLLYLAREIKHSSAVAEVQAKFSAMRLLSEYTAGLVENPELNELFVRGRRNMDDVTDEQERSRFLNMCLRAFWFFSASHFQRVRGQLSDDEWKETESVFHFWIGGPGVQTWWNRWGREAFGARFVMYVDSEIPKVNAARAARRKAAAD